jgi:hypothetical protein
LNAFDLIDTGPQAGGRLAVKTPADWLVTPLMEDTDAVSLDKADKGYADAAIVYNKNGKGFLVGPVGPAEAYTTTRVSKQAVTAIVNMDGVLVRPGESRRSEEMLFIFEPVGPAVTTWTRWVAETHGTRLNKGPRYGWCSWYDRTTKIDEQHVMSVISAIEQNPNTFGKGIIQIDDGYQVMDGDWSANKKFPSGMAAVAKRIREAGHTPGVWFAPLMMHPKHPWMAKNPEAIQQDAKGIASFMNANPFHPAGANWINPSHPEAKKFLFNIIKDARERGFGYIKIDFNGIGSRFVDPTKTRLQIFRELYTLYREAAGEDMYILSCLGSPTRGVIGFVDAARVGPDSHPCHFDQCLKSVLRFQIYHNVWWQNDPDVSYLAEDLKGRSLGRTRQGKGLWQTWHNVVCLVGGTAMISEPVNLPSAKDVFRNYEIMRPASREPAKLLTLGKTPDNELFGFSAERKYGNFAVYNLYNVNSKAPKSITLDFKEAGIQAGVECAVFDFWDNKVVGYATDTFTAKDIGGYSSRLLRFTPLDRKRPCLIGSNLHLSMGATEIEDVRVSGTSLTVVSNDAGAQEKEDVRVSGTSLTVVLNDAGAQEGVLTFFSTQKLSMDKTKNCKAGLVKDLGNNIWQVGIAGREWGKPQTISLRIGG